MYCSLVNPHANACVFFDQHLVAGSDERLGSRRNERYAVFVGLNFSGYAYLHGKASHLNAWVMVLEFGGMGDLA